jgi:hypothetical protein
MPSKLDQFFTKPEEAQRLYAITQGIINHLSLNNNNYLEPAAGAGAFYNCMPIDKRTGIDLEPRLPDIIKHDYLTWEPPKDIRFNIIGNPPFGRRSKLATQFINKSVSCADLIAFILPLGMKRWHCQYQVSWDLDLVYQEDLKDDIFELPNGKKYKLFTCFQIWVNKKVNPQ